MEAAHRDDLANDAKCKGVVLVDQAIEWVTQQSRRSALVLALRLCIAAIFSQNAFLGLYADVLFMPAWRAILDDDSLTFETAEHVACTASLLLLVIFWSYYLKLFLEVSRGVVTFEMLLLYLILPNIIVSSLAFTFGFIMAVTVGWVPFWSIFLFCCSFACIFAFGLIFGLIVVTAQYGAGTQCIKYVSYCSTSVLCLWCSIKLGFQWHWTRRTMYFGSGAFLACIIIVTIGASIHSDTSIVYPEIMRIIVCSSWGFMLLRLIVWMMTWGVRLHLPPFTSTIVHSTATVESVEEMQHAKRLEVGKLEVVGFEYESPARCTRCQLLASPHIDASQATIATSANLLANAVEIVDCHQSAGNTRIEFKMSVSGSHASTYQEAIDELTQAIECSDFESTFVDQAEKLGLSQTAHFRVLKFSSSTSSISWEAPDEALDMDKQLQGSCDQQDSRWFSGLPSMDTVTLSRNMPPSG